MTNKYLLIMQKVNVFFAVVFVFLLSVSANAQISTGADYFVGQWNVLAEGVPGGFDKRDSCYYCK
jgi:hypothetical protein